MSLVVPRTRSQSASAMVVPCDVIGCGTQGIAEMQRWINDTTVSWALLRVDVGEGPLRRRQIAFLHINSENCPQVKRAKLNRESTADIKNVLRGGEDGHYTFHAQLEVFSKSDVTARNILEKCSKHFLKDVHAGKSTQWLIEQYEKRFQPEDACAGNREIDRCPGEDLALEEVVKLMHGDSNYNWALFGANMEWVRSARSLSCDRSASRARSRAPAAPEEAMLLVPLGGWGDCSRAWSRSNSRNRANAAKSKPARTSAADASSTFVPSLPPIESLRAPPTESQRTLPTVTLPSGSDSARAPTFGDWHGTSANAESLDPPCHTTESIATTSTVHRTETDVRGGIVTTDAVGAATNAQSLDPACHTTEMASHTFRRGDIVEVLPPSLTCEAVAASENVAETEVKASTAPPSLTAEPPVAVENVNQSSLNTYPLYLWQPRAVSEPQPTSKGSRWRCCVRS